jgi:hypothetical protein
MIENMDNIEFKKFRPRYPGDPALEEKNRIDRELDGVTPIPIIRLSGEFDSLKIENGLKKLWRKLMKGVSKNE